MAMAMASESDDDDDDDDEGNPDLLLLTLLNLNDQEEEEEVEQQLNLKLKLKPKPSQNQELDQQHYLKSIDSTLTIRQLPSQGLSFQLWPAASTLVSLLSLSSPLRILDLGSGTGLLGHAAAILRAHVTLTDLPHVIPNLHFNAAANAPLIASRGGSIAFQELSWGEDNQIGEFDVVIASDVVYYDHLFEPLLRTLRGFVKGEVGFVMGHLKRWKKRDAVFFKKARKVFDVEMIHRDMSLPGSRIGVPVYGFTAKKNGL